MSFPQVHPADLSEELAKLDTTVTKTPAGGPDGTGLELSGQPLPGRPNAASEKALPVSSPGLTSTTASITDESLPVTPDAGLPPNFGTVVDGLYRSAFPQQAHFEYLADLGLRSILTLVDEPYDPPHLNFLASAGIAHYTVPVPPHKAETDRIPDEALENALRVPAGRGSATATRASTAPGASSAPGVCARAPASTPSWANTASTPAPRPAPWTSASCASSMRPACATSTSSSSTAPG